MDETQAVFSPSYENRLVLHTSGGESVDLMDHYRGEALFITLGGPSLAESDLEALRASGVMTMGVNNTWAVYRPDIWVCIDHASTFLPEGWKDPRILKLTPCSQRKTRLRARDLHDGGFRTLGLTPGRCPNTMFFNPSACFNPTNFLTQPRVDIGAPGGSRDRLGVKGCRSVFLAALRLGIYLGFRRIYLLGADFHMADAGEGAQYATGESKSELGVDHNNRTYRALNARMEALGPYLSAHGVSVTNLTPSSGLTSVPLGGLSEALAREGVSGPEGVDAVGFYTPHKPIEDSVNEEAGE